MLRTLLLSAAAISSLVQTPAQPAAGPPRTDIHELGFSGRVDDLRKAAIAPVAVARGYDNQPFYTPDGAAILFTANRDGKQTDIYEFTRATRKESRLVATPEGEYSPTVTPDGRGFSVIRVEADGTQRLWRFDRTGANPSLVLAEIKPVGYHVWIDNDQLALFVLGQPATLQLAKLSTGKADTLASDIGRSLQRVPAGKASAAAVSFVHREAEGRFAVKRLDPATRAISTIAAVPAASTDRDTAWLPDGTLLLSAGTRIMAWSGREWREVFDAAAHKLGAITRMAASPDGRSLAIVTNEMP